MSKEFEHLSVVEELEPINQFSSHELIDSENQIKDFKAQLDNFYEIDYNHEVYDDFFNEEELYMVEYPVEKEIFDDLGDTIYINQGIKRENAFEEPFYTNCPMHYLNENLLYIEDYEKSFEFINKAHFPDDLEIEEPADDNMNNLIQERLLEEKNLDELFIEVYNRDKYFDNLINNKFN